MRLLIAIFCALLFLSTPSLAKTSALKIEAKTAETRVHSGERFVVDVFVTNNGSWDQVWTHAQCSNFPSGWWTIDNPRFHVVVNDDACRYIKKNPLVDEKLAIGKAVHWALSVQFNAHSDTLGHRTVSFRLGFKPHHLLAPPAEEETAWSNPVVVSVNK